MKPKVLLIVEDDKTLMEALKEKFSVKDFSILEAMDAESAVDVALKNHPDLILLDIILPRGNGVMAMDKIREDNWGKNVPIIILSNLNPNDRMVSEVVREQPAYYLLKAETPIDDVLEKVKEVLREKQNQG